MSEARRFTDVDDLIDSLGISDADIYCKEILREAPIVDAVEVVRCKDCRNRQGECWCSKHSEIVSDDDSCSYGERRDSGG